ncbi:Txe/YoeB family addiction module toxin [Capnocytophaga bilenii]|uniref:Txe/YoeB family addiction module toxin n=1 Tax=Capnocytophaga bilenii TaxID=2819369 RepID=UPI0028D7A09A|nr:Txe/YoeB family addiction module toxin [Capnocytophaga bilenii]
MEEETYKLKYSDEYLDHIDKHLKSGQKKLLAKIDSLLDELETHPTTGTGQVEPLKGYGERNVYSRRIDQKHRLTYEVFAEGKYVEVLSAYGHYE